MKNPSWWEEEPEEEFPDNEEYIYDNWIEYKMDNITRNYEEVLSEYEKRLNRDARKEGKEG